MEKALQNAATKSSDHSNTSSSVEQINPKPDNSVQTPQKSSLKGVSQSLIEKVCYSKVNIFFTGYTTTHYHVVVCINEANSAGIFSFCVFNHY